MVRQGGGIGKVVWYRLARVGQEVGEGGGAGKVVREGHPGKASLGVLAEGETSGQWGRRGNVRQLEKNSLLAKESWMNGSFTLHVSILFLLGFGWDGHFRP